MKPEYQLQAQTMIDVYKFTEEFKGGYILHPDERKEIEKKAINLGNMTCGLFVGNDEILKDILMGNLREALKDATGKTLKVSHSVKLI